jgi:hypothetical protein
VRAGGSTRTEPPPAKHAAALTIVGGNNQSGSVGASLSQILVVRVDDQTSTAALRHAGKKVAFLGHAKHKSQGKVGKKKFRMTEQKLRGEKLYV